MERIHALIGQLHQQSLQNANPANLLLTVQLLQAELVKLQQKNGTLGTSKVAVTLPVTMNFSEEVVRPQRMEAPAPPPPVPGAEAPAPEPRPFVAAVPPPPPPGPAPVAEEEPISPYAPKEYILNKPREVFHSEPPPAYEPAPVTQVLNPALTSVAEASTLATPREVHEVIAQKQESLNDRLKQDKTEVAHVLKDTPIKDLRKGIGINDRFSFVNELFRGDEAMYERSIKTINGFHILSEAEYWINRELKFKLGWNDSKDIVQHFYQLVRRRFS